MEKKPEGKSPSGENTGWEKPAGEKLAEKRPVGKRPATVIRSFASRRDEKDKLIYYNFYNDLPNNPA